MMGRNSTYLHHPARPTTSLVDLDGVEILLHHHQYLHHHHHYQQSPEAASFSSLYAPLENSALFNQENGEPSSMAKKPTTTTTGKKDRHSKIHTAQGPRDRRVRLSIAIARKFFDLQEMLGFDKPSKTLDWLLTKSKTAIKDLVQKHHQQSSSPSAASACEMPISSSDHSKRKVGKESLAKESRAKARARARERTLEKMYIKQFGADRCSSGSDLNSSFNQLEFLQLSAGSSSNNNLKGSGGFHFPSSNEAGRHDLIQESINAIKRKNKSNPSSSSSSLLGFQQNLVFSTDLNSNYMIPSSACNTNNQDTWDVFGLNSQANLHAALDHHKFFNSNSNI